MSTGLAILPPEQIVPAEWMDDELVNVVYVFDDLPDDYRRQPTQKQVDTLTRFMGRGLGWCVDSLLASNG